jgi:hypothetical protein
VVPYPAVVAFRDTASDLDSGLSGQVTLAEQDRIGTAYGVAVDARDDAVYLGAYHKRTTRFGPGGPGAIYRLDLRTGDSRLWQTLEAGADHHRYDVDQGDDYDAAAVPWAGKVSLGDIDLSEAGNELFAVNLFDRRIYRLSVQTGQVLGSFGIGSGSETWAARARPFGLGYHDGWLYHGVVDSCEWSSDPRCPTGHVYRSRDDGTQMSEVTAFSFDYRARRQWSGWFDDAQVSRAGEYFSQPLIADIEFGSDGSMVLGLKDRQGMQFSPPTDEGRGDILLAAMDGRDGFRVQTSLEIYPDDFKWEESATGALATVAGGSSLVAAMPLPHVVAGATWYDTATGSIRGPVDGQEVVAVDDYTTGDLEALCSPPVPLYLPFSSRATCLKPKAPVDVVLVLDMSTSMSWLTREGRTKAAAAVDAARQFLAPLRLQGATGVSGNQASITAFNDIAWSEQALTSDRSLLESALTRVLDRMAEGTRLDLALQQAHASAVGAGHRAGNRPVIVVLTDGLPNRVPPGPDGRPETTILAAAEAAKRDGATLFTVGVGLPDDLDEMLLQRIASVPMNYQRVADAEDLLAIYGDLVSQVECLP